MKAFRKLLTVCMIAVVCTACSKDEDSSSEGTYFVKFDYKGEHYIINGDEETKGRVYFNRLDNSIAIVGFDLSGKNLAILIEQDVKAGIVYDIMGGDTSTQPAIVLTYASVLPSVADMTTVGTGRKVGELSINKLTDKIINGTFHCTMISGEMSNGEFCAPFSGEE